MPFPAFRITPAAPLRRALNALRTHLPPLNFITLHYGYFVTVCLFSAIVFWGIATPKWSISFTDSLFFTVSAMTLAGLNTINLSQLNTAQQIMLFILIMMGSTILVSSVVVEIRKRAFEKRFVGLKKVGPDARGLSAKSAGVSRGRSWSRSGQRGRIWASGTSVPRPTVDGVVVRGRVIGSPRGREDPSDDPQELQDIARDKTISDSMTLHSASKTESAMYSENYDSARSRASGVEQLAAPDADENTHVHFARPTPLSPRRHARFMSMSGVGARTDILNHPSRVIEKEDPSFQELPVQPGWLGDGMTTTEKYFESNGRIGRNSQFHSLSLTERERLGGVEYRAVLMLRNIVLLYYILFQLLGSLGLAAWVANNQAATTLENGLNPWWVGAFNAVSAFNNSGMSLLDANMVAFQNSPYVLLTMGLLILAGNTCYPIFLRLIIWTIYKVLPKTTYWEENKRTLRFLLDHPRRCYTTLFPSNHTWWLLATVMLFNGIDWAAFEILNIGNATVTQLPQRVLDGLFQAFAVRSGGFYVVNIPQLRIGNLILYTIMMYISVYPVTITMRSSNIYEERSLGIYADDTEHASYPNPGNKRTSFFSTLRRHLVNDHAEDSRAYFVRQQLRGQLAHDIWWLCLAVLFIAIIESGSFEADPVNYSVFNILFETVSAYGTVGISVGLPGVDYSFCGGWHTLSKLILCAVMLRGRHRGLPVAIDRAVLLPGEHLGIAEEQDAAMRRERTMERDRTRERRSMSAADLHRASAGIA